MGLFRTPQTFPNPEYDPIRIRIWSGMASQIWVGTLICFLLGLTAHAQLGCRIGPNMVRMRVWSTTREQNCDLISLWLDLTAHAQLRWRTCPNMIRMCPVWASLHPETLPSCGIMALSRVWQPTMGESKSSKTCFLVGP